MNSNTTFQKAIISCAILLCKTLILSILCLLPQGGMAGNGYNNTLDETTRVQKPLVEVLTHQHSPIGNTAVQLPAKVLKTVSLPCPASFQEFPNAGGTAWHVIVIRKTLPPCYPADVPAPDAHPHPHRHERRKDEDVDSADTPGTRVAIMSLLAIFIVLEISPLLFAALAPHFL